MIIFKEATILMYLHIEIRCFIELISMMILEFFYSILIKEEPIYVRKSSSDYAGMAAAPSNSMVPKNQSQQNRLVPFEDDSTFYSVQEDTDCSAVAPQTYASVVKKH